MTSNFRDKILCSGAIALALCGVGGAARAQNVPTSQSELVRSSASDALTSNLSRLVKNPRDMNALIGAGDAALELGDPQAALGFYGRADDVSGLNGRVKAGLGRAMLALQQTADALQMLNQATSLGYADGPTLSDRGLARDLTGDQAGAQADYQAALRFSAGGNDTIRRYAISLGISGQLDQAEKVIQPLLYKSDRAAWRDRAFILAMNGKHEQATAITKQVMPPQLATAIQPYMDRMHMLTAVQRAEAVHLGKFPPGLVRVAIAPVRQVPAIAQAAHATGKAGRTRSKTTETQIAAAPTAPTRQTPNWNQSPSQPAAPRTVQQVPEQRPVSRPVSRPAQRAVQGPSLSGFAVPTLPQVSQPSPNQSATASPSNSVPPPIDYSRVEPVAPLQSRPAATPPEPAASKPDMPATQTAAAPVVQGPAAAAPASALAASVAPAPAAPSAVTPVVSPSMSEAAVRPELAAPSARSPVTATRSLAEIMAEVKVPEAEQQQSVAAVDLAEIAALQAERRKAKIAAEAKAKKDAEIKLKKEAEARAKAEALAEKKRLAANPARIWVQVATGRSTSALAFDLKKMRKKYADAMGSKGAATAQWGSTNRLVVGPFASSAKARDFEAAMKKAGSDAFVWNSDAGEEVSPLGSK